MPYCCKYIFICLCFALFSGKVSGTGFRDFFRNGEKETIDADQLRMEKYIDRANAFLRSEDLIHAKIYLDSAALYQQENIHPEILGYFYFTIGYYYEKKIVDEKAYEYYYRAIGCYEKAGKERLNISIYHNLSRSYIQKNDTKSLKRIIDKMLPLALKSNDSINIADTYRVISFYYNCLYEKDKTQEIFLDSAILYNKKVVHLFETSQKMKIRKKEIAYNYIHLASNLLEKEEKDLELAALYLRKATEYADPIDTAMLINCLWVKGEMVYASGKTREAERIFKQQLALMNQWQKEENLNLFLNVYDRLSEISEKAGNFREATLYERRKINCLNNIHDSEKYRIITELETEYEVSKKDSEIAQLHQVNRFKGQINLLILSVFFVCAIALFAIIHWQRSKKKAAYSQLQVTQMEKDEAMLEAALKAEELKRSELEKFEILLEKDSQEVLISGMDEELSELKKEQKRLSAEISAYKNKAELYEKNRQNKLLGNITETYHALIMNEISDLIQRRLKNIPEQAIYLERLRNINDRFFLNLKKTYQGNLSITNIKYCICFVTGMEVRHIAECLSVEPRTIHITKVRLKEKFEFDKQFEFELFLKQMISVKY